MSSTNLLLGQHLGHDQLALDRNVSQIFKRQEFAILRLVLRVGGHDAHQILDTDSKLAIFIISRLYLNIHIYRLNLYESLSNMNSRLDSSTVGQHHVFIKTRIVGIVSPGNSHWSLVDTEIVTNTMTRSV